MSVLTKAAILAANDIKRESVSVPEWGGEVFVRTLKGWERDRYDSDMRESFATKEPAHLRAKLVAVALCDDKGSSLGFTPAELLELSDKSSAALDRVYEVAARLCGLFTGATNADTVTIPADSEKNLNGQSGGSG